MIQPTDTDVVLGGGDRDAARLPHPGAVVLGGFGTPKISELIRQGIQAPSGKWAALRVPNGSDRFTRLSLRELEKLVPTYNRETIARLWVEQCRRDRTSEDFPDGDRASCYRWYLRGLHPGCAVWKVRIDRTGPRIDC